VTGLLLGAALILAALFGMPLFVVIGLVALVLFAQAGISSSAVAIEMFRVAEEPMLIAIPLFTFAGYLFAESGAPTRLVRVSNVVFSRFPGGLGVVALVACAIFTAFTGASGVTIIALGGLLLPALLQDRYPERFTLGLLTTSGSLGLLFPPSLAIILYAYVAQVSVDQLFVAGVLPGILLIVLLSLYVQHTARRAQIRRRRVEWRSEAWPAIREAIWEIPLPLLVLAGIYGGVLKIVEAAALTASYALIVEVFIYKDITVRRLPEIVRESMILVGGILIILSSALGFTNYLVDAEVPMRLLEWIQGFVTSKLMFLLLLNVFLLIVGCLMDIFSALIVVVPLIVPVAEGYGVSLVHLGIVFLTNLEIGYSTPPVGLNLFISSFRFRRPVLEVYRASLPFLAILLVALAIITYVPALSLALVELFGVR
jgi:tripartite ATP-independent transporter DctM subunit